MAVDRHHLRQFQAGHALATHVDIWLLRLHTQRSIHVWAHTPTPVIS